MKISGSTMGTTYSILYDSQTNYQAQIDSLLVEVNGSVSTYIPTSIISQVNQAEALEPIRVDRVFMDNFKVAKEIYHLTSGSFNPAIMPLVNYWGFGYERLNEVEIDTAEVHRLLDYSNLSHFHVKNNTVAKAIAEAELDFSGLAKGYGVDEIGRYLTDQGVQNYLIEIGGETLAKGSKPNGEPWKVGIQQPFVDRKQASTVIELQNAAMATSGNYEQYKRLDNGRTISHTINPKTGFPQEIMHEVLSSTVIAKACVQADAYATAFKVMGLEKSKEVIARLKDIEVYLIYLDEDGEHQIWYSGD